MSSGVKEGPDEVSGTGKLRWISLGPSFPKDRIESDPSEEERFEDGISWFTIGDIGGELMRPGICRVASSTAKDLLPSKLFPRDLPFVLSCIAAIKG